MTLPRKHNEKGVGSRGVATDHLEVCDREGLNPNRPHGYCFPTPCPLVDIFGYRMSK